MRRLLLALGAEALGTFLLLAAAFATAGLEMPAEAAALAVGATVALLIHAFGPLSGAHFNPAVSLAFAATRKLRLTRFAPYVAAQAVGAALAVLSVAAWMPTTTAVVAPPSSPQLAASVEVLGTALVMFTITVAATFDGFPRRLVAPAIGAALAIAILFAAPLSGASLNPLRSLAPALASGDLRGLAVTAGAPLVGALAGAFLAEALRPHRLARLTQFLKQEAMA